MVFVGGPRQVGKTTLARLVGEGFGAATYLSRDHRPHRRALLDGHWPPGTDLLILGEIHKWPRLVRGLWDTRPSGERIIVTGSSRLDIYRRGGDSLLGRYRYYRLHPFSPGRAERTRRSPLSLSHRAAPPGPRSGRPPPGHPPRLRRLPRALPRRPRAHPQALAEGALRAGLPGGHPRDRGGARPGPGRAAGQPDPRAGSGRPCRSAAWPRMSRPAPRPSGAGSSCWPATTTCSACPPGTGVWSGP